MCAVCTAHLPLPQPSSRTYCLGGHGGGKGLHSPLALCNYAKSTQKSGSCIPPKLIAGQFCHLRHTRGIYPTTAPHTCAYLEFPPLGSQSLLAAALVDQRRLHVGNFRLRGGNARTAGQAGDRDSRWSVRGPQPRCNRFKRYTLAAAAQASIPQACARLTRCASTSGQVSAPAAVDGHSCGGGCLIIGGEDENKPRQTTLV